MTEYRLAILDDYQQVSGGYADWASLGSGVSVTVFSKPFTSEADVVQALLGFDVVVAMRQRTPFPRAVLAKLPPPETAGDNRRRKRRHRPRRGGGPGVTVCGTAGSPSAAPELTWALLTALARNVTAEENALRAGRWQHTVGSELAGENPGDRRAGQTLATRWPPNALAFGMDVVAWSQNLDEATATAAGVRRVDKDELFRGVRRRDPAPPSLPAVGRDSR